jgi:hypothetical protein
MSARVIGPAARGELGGIVATRPLSTMGEAEGIVIDYVSGIFLSRLPERTIFVPEAMSCRVTAFAEKAAGK